MRREGNMVHNNINPKLLKRKAILLFIFVVFAAIGLLFFGKVAKKDVKSVPIVMVADFEKRYSNNYELLILL